MVRNHIRGRGGNVPFVVTGAENFVKEERPSRWAEGLEAVLAKVSQKPGDSSVLGRGMETSASFPSNPPLGAASDFGGSENL